MRAHERLLRALVGRRIVAEQVAQKSPHAWRFSIENHAKCLRIARPCARQQLLVGLRHGGTGHFDT